MAITAQEVNKLRQMTGAGMMDCLVEKVTLTKQLKSLEKKDRSFLRKELTEKLKKVVYS